MYNFEYRKSNKLHMQVHTGIEKRKEKQRGQKQSIAAHYAILIRDNSILRRRYRLLSHRL